MTNKNSPVSQEQMENYKKKLMEEKVVIVPEETPRIPAVNIHNRNVRMDDLARDLEKKLPK